MISSTLDNKDPDLKKERNQYYSQSQKTQKLHKNKQTIRNRT